MSAAGPCSTGPSSPRPRLPPGVWSLQPGGGGVGTPRHGGLAAAPDFDDDGTMTDTETLTAIPCDPSLRDALVNVIDALSGFEPPDPTQTAGWHYASAVCLDALVRYDSPSGMVISAAVMSGRKVRVAE